MRIKSVTHKGVLSADTKYPRRFDYKQSPQTFYSQIWIDAIDY